MVDTYSESARSFPGDSRAATGAISLCLFPLLMRSIVRSRNGLTAGANQKRRPISEDTYRDTSEASGYPKTLSDTLTLHGAADLAQGDI